MSHARTHEPGARITRDEFLARVEQQPSGRYERIDGIVVAMAPERAAHVRRKHAACNALQRALRDAGLTTCEALTDGMTVSVKDSDFKPDAMLRCGPELPGNATRAPDPMILVELPSPGSGTRDRATKLRTCLKLPTVRHYLVTWPEELRIVRHSRRPGDEIATDTFLAGPMALDPPGTAVTVEAFYED
jgi:Uma2 family endonuclease